MNVTEIRSIARAQGVRPLPKTKLALIRTLQAAEGNFPCFGTAVEHVCDQAACLWRSDCFKQSKSTRVARMRRHD